MRHWRQWLLLLALAAVFAAAGRAVFESGPPAAGTAGVISDGPPQRVALVFFHFGDALLSLERPPVAAPQVNTLKNWASLKPYLAGSPVIDLGRQSSLNMERLLDVQPELIIGERYNAGRYHALARIAPVVLLDNQKLFRDWRDILREVAALTGREAAAEARILRVERLIAAARPRLSTVRDDSFAFLAPFEKGMFFAYGRARLPAFLDPETGLGLKTPAGYTNTAARLSLEGVALLNPDHIFLSRFPGDARRLAELQKSPVWNALAAVKRGNVHFLDQSAFLAGSLAVEYGVNSVVTSLTEG
ncbi:MAG: ABC transporter substrate-binding protein [Sporomusaceae bacterium]|nr:ABC transporter substrate-binding protein [Sporomusaceae bacterium]